VQVRDELVSCLGGEKNIFPKEVLGGETGEMDEM